MTITNTFKNRVGNIPLADLDTNFTDLDNSLSSKANINSPAFTGTPTAPTAAAGTSTTQIATTAFAMANGFPTGGIIMWSGTVAAIPSGWKLCDGTNGTPDLRNRFIVGAGSTYNPAATGGTADAIVPSHSHTATSNTSISVNDPGHRHWISSASYDDGNGSGTGNNTQEYGLWADAGTYSANDPNKSTGRYSLGNTTGITASGTTTTTVNSEGVSATNANLPPYYALAFIMKV